MTTSSMDFICPGMKIGILIQSISVSSFLWSIKIRVLCLSKLLSHLKMKHGAPKCCSIHCINVSWGTGCQEVTATWCWWWILCEEKGFERMLSNPQRCGKDCEWYLCKSQKVLHVCNSSPRKWMLNLLSTSFMQKFSGCLVAKCWTDLFLCEKNSVFLTAEGDEKAFKLRDNYWVAQAILHGFNLWAVSPVEPSPPRQRQEKH